MNFDSAETKKRFTDFCKKNKVTQVKLADAVGLTQGSVYRWFDTKSDTMPTFQALYWLAVNFGLDLEWLVIGTIKNGENSNIDSVKELAMQVKVLSDVNKEFSDNVKELTKRLPEKV